MLHLHSHTTLSDIGCVVASLGVLGEFCICGDAFVFQQSDNATI